MSKPHSIFVALTNEQVIQLERHFDHVREQAKLNERGMLIAQVYEWHPTYGQPGPFMRVGFIEHELASNLEGKATG